MIDEAWGLRPLAFGQGSFLSAETSSLRSSFLSGHCTPFATFSEHQKGKPRISCPMRHNMQHSSALDVGPLVGLGGEFGA
jgi:hypothetical protein